MRYLFLWNLEYLALESGIQACIGIRNPFSIFKWNHRIQEYSFAAASLILLCLFNIAKFIAYLVGDTSLRLIYIH